MAVNSGAKQPWSNSRKPSGHRPGGRRNCWTRRTTVPSPNARCEDSTEHVIASRTAFFYNDAAPTEKRIVPARSTMAKSPLSTCQESERTKALCNMTNAKAKPPRRKAVRSVVAAFCLLLVVARKRNTAALTIRVTSRRTVLAFVIAVGVAQRYTLTIWALSLQNRKSKTLPITAFTARAKTKPDTVYATNATMHLPMTCLFQPSSKENAAVAINQAAAEYRPVSDAIRNAMAQSKAATIPST